MHKLFICFLLSNFLFITAAGNQRATISHFEVHPCRAATGAACYCITGSINFKKSLDDFKNTGDSLAKNYILTIKFKEGVKPVTANPGFSNYYCNETGIITLVKTLKLSQSDIYDYDFSFLLPSSAFNLPEGKHFLIPLIDLSKEDNTQYILHNQKMPSVQVNIAPVIKVRTWVKHILVDSLDANGQLWDYFVFNPIESNPDIVWSLKYAGKTYFTSKMAKNAFEYFDLQHSQTYDLIISKGDSVTIEVRDVDDLTPDDIIGTIILAPLNSTQKSDEIFTSKAGQIKSIDYVISVLP